MPHTGQPIRSNNHHAVEQLKLLGYPMPNIRAALQRLTGETQPETAARLNMKRSSFNKYMNGRRFEKTEIMSRIAEAFQVPTDVLFSDVIKAGRKTTASS